MLPDNLVVSVTDVLRYCQKKERVFVAARSGFSNASYFRTVFKAKVGKTVKEFLREKI